MEQWTAHCVIKLIRPTATQANQARAATSSPTSNYLRYQPASANRARKDHERKRGRNLGAKQADEATSVDEYSILARRTRAKDVKDTTTHQKCQKGNVMFERRFHRVQRGNRRHRVQRGTNTARDGGRYGGGVHSDKRPSPPSGIGQP